MSNSLWPHVLKHARLPCPSPTPRAYSNSCHPTISSSVVPFSSRLWSFPASGSFPMSQFFTSGSQSVRVSASTSVFPMNIQGWFPLGFIGWISLQSKGLSRVFSNTTVQKHQFFFFFFGSTVLMLLFFFSFFFFFLFVVNFVIHWNKTAMSLHVFPIPIPPPTSLSTRSP